MIVSNNRLIIAFPEDLESLEKALASLIEIYGEDKGFAIAEHDVPGVGLINGIAVEGLLTPEEIRDAIEDLKFAAFGPETVKMPGKFAYSFEHKFTDTELGNLGTSLAGKIHEQAREEAEKSQIVKEFKTRIDGLNEEITEISEKIRLGHEERTKTGVSLILDHSLKIRIYVDENDQILGQEPFKPGDLQRQLFEDPAIAFEASTESLDGKVIPLLPETTDGEKADTEEEPVVDEQE